MVKNNIVVSFGHKLLKFQNILNFFFKKEIPSPLGYERKNVNTSLEK